MASALRTCSALIPLKNALIPQKSALLPVVRRVVVALGALDLLTQEQPRRARGQRNGIKFEVSQNVVDCAVFLVGAGGGDQLVDDLIPGPIRNRTACAASSSAPRDRPSAPDCPGRSAGRSIGWRNSWRSRDARAGTRSASPACPFHESKERPGFLHVGNPPEQVDVNPAQELLIGGGLRRLHSGCLPTFLD